MILNYKFHNSKCVMALVPLVFSCFFVFSATVSSANDPMCSGRDGFVWSRIVGKCVQEICPYDSIGRDAVGDCACPENLNEEFSRGFLVGCVEATREETMVYTIENEAPSTVMAETVAGSASGIGSTTREIATRKTRSANAMPNTITIIILIALGLGYWLFKLPPVKKK